jgi:hypothetical protein
MCHKLMIRKNLPERWSDGVGERERSSYVIFPRVLVSSNAMHTVGQLHITYQSGPFLVVLEIDRS